ncbi:hypothetical protein [Sphingomonas alpina]|uniref:Uncharacterized protein n=1 Tax=Sphingomonas alpina TaxID=653931 RepID=A0A7H0LFI1_9SPHN|nr:hypothetical protein [Sphingomonas alpina]QNQ08434.1 hypothetical protein H3Z74_17000 [Sphingomonas alpina]
MTRSITIIIVMLLGPAGLVFAAGYTGFLSTGSHYLSTGILLAAWAIGIAALIMSRWSATIKVAVIAAYTLASIPAFWFIGLLAVCSTGNCL